MWQSGGAKVWLVFSDEPPALTVEHRSVASSELHCCHKAQVVDVVFLPSRMIKTKAYKYICSSPFNWIFRLDNLSLVSLEWARATEGGSKDEQLHHEMVSRAFRAVTGFGVFY